MNIADKSFIHDDCVKVSVHFSFLFFYLGLHLKIFSSLLNLILKLLKDLEDHLESIKQDLQNLAPHIASAHLGIPKIHTATATVWLRERKKKLASNIPHQKTVSILRSSFIKNPLYTQKQNSTFGQKKKRLRQTEKKVLLCLTKQTKKIKHVF